MEIRLATLKDVEKISRIYALSWKEGYKGIISEKYLEDLKEDYWVPFFTQGIQEESISVKLLLDGARPIGCIAYGVARESAYEGWGEIYAVYLLPNYYDRGLGGLLIREAIQEFRKAHNKGVYLWVLEENKRARRFYEKHHFYYNEEECKLKISNQEVVDKRYIYPFSEQS